MSDTPMRVAVAEYLDTLAGSNNSSGPGYSARALEQLWNEFGVQETERCIVEMLSGVDQLDMLPELDPETGMWVVGDCDEEGGNATYFAFDTKLEADHFINRWAAHYHVQS